MRLDKYLVECGIGSRKEVKKIIDGKLVSVNDKIISSPKENVDEEKMNWFLSKFKKLENNKELFRAVKKLNRQ